MSSPGPKDSRKFKGSRWRWLMLVMACNYLIGSYFCYDNPGVLEGDIQSVFGISQTTESLLYTVYSYPNTVLPLFGGIFIDAIGMRPGILLFSTLLLAG